MTTPMNPPERPRGPSLRIVCVNDIYTLENLPRLATLVEHARTDDPADLFLSTLAGDFVGPSMLSSLDSGRGMVDCLNAIPITHVCFGNHEDDIPLAQLRLRIAEFRGTWLDSNVRGVEPALPAHQILEVKAEGKRTVKVGLVGVVMSDPTVYRGKPFGQREIAPANETVLREAELLVKEGGCAIVLPLTHQTIDEDRALAKVALASRIPVIIGGHEHTVFIEEIEHAFVVKAAADAVHAVILDLRWPEQAPASGPDLPLVTVRIDDVARYEEDASLRARVDAHMVAVHELEAATLRRLSSGESLSSVGTRSRQTSMGTLVCSLVRDALGADGAIMNGGGIRGSRDYRDRFTYGDLKAEIPFDNEVVVARIPGRVLREAIESSRSHAPAESGGFLQIDDRMSAEGARLFAIDGAPTDDAREYRIALVRNLFTGMDHIEPFVAFARAHPERIPPMGSGREIKEVLVHAFSLALFSKLGDFEAVDTNHDGSLSVAEISAAISRVNAEPASPVTVGLVFDAVDTDHDRQVTREEAARASAEERARRERKG
jgi:2',3'-cyclic-nucleotide 2'-phosphodiesterase (5'-nucleotidase family)